MPFYEKLTYQLEFITPAFIGGAFHEEQAELRPSSFIGILRWWFRNLAATVTSDIDAIYTIESELFGNTEKAGKVWVKIEPIKENIEINPENIKELLLNTATEITSEFSKKKSEKFYPYLYLGYGNILQKKGRNFLKKNFLISRGKPSYKISILVSKKYLKLVEALIQITSQLGSIGGRNRRGWGSFYLTSEGNKNFFNVEVLRNFYQIFKCSLINLLKCYKSEYLRESLIPLQKVLIWSLRLENESSLELLKEFADKYHRFRNRKNPDYCLIKKYLVEISRLKINLKRCYNVFKKYTRILKRNDSVIYNRAWFGLPIIVRYNSISQNKNSVVINIFSDKELRLASPLIVRVVKINANQYKLLLILIENNKFFKKERKDSGLYKWSFSVGAVKAKGINKKVLMDKSLKKFIEDFIKNEFEIENFVEWG